MSKAWFSKAMIRIAKLEDSTSILTRRRVRLEEAEVVVRPILEAVRNEGDAAVIRYAREFDGLGDRPLRIPEEELAEARSGMDVCVLRARKPLATTSRRLH